MEYGKLIQLDTDHMEKPGASNDLYENRTMLVEMQQTSIEPEVSITILAYNRLEKTKRCVESVLKYTQGINYELILMDSGSEPDVLEYYKSVPYEKKKIYRFTKNLGAFYPYTELNLNQLGRYVCVLTNDLIVTEGWLNNLLTCMKSDNRIGMVNPVSSNTSNLQCVEFDYSSYEEMQEKAKAFNHSDPRKWEDRLRLITLGTLFRKEALMTARWPISDCGFSHDFGDDDATFSLRRAGYRTVLAGDTWICHDHRVNQGEGKDPVKFQESLKIGRKNFMDKYYGVDAWEDVNNFLAPYLGSFVPKSLQKNSKILGVDVRCGTPILDLQNHLRKLGVFDSELSAFTQDPKYWLDLKTICKGPVMCDREEFLGDSFVRESFDFVVADRPLNRYHEPQKMILDLFSLCKSGGYVFCRLKNTHSFQEYVNILGQRDMVDSEIAYSIPLETFNSVLTKIGTVESIIPVPFSLDEESENILRQLIPAELPEGNRRDILMRMTCKEYLFIVRKL